MFGKLKNYLWRIVRGIKTFWFFLITLLCSMIILGYFSIYYSYAAELTEYFNDRLSGLLFLSMAVYLIVLLCATYQHFKQKTSLKSFFEYRKLILLSTYPKENAQYLLIRLKSKEKSIHFLSKILTTLLPISWFAFLFQRETLLLSEIAIVLTVLVLGLIILIGLIFRNQILQKKKDLLEEIILLKEIEETIGKTPYYLESEKTKDF